MTGTGDRVANPGLVGEALPSTITEPDLARGALVLAAATIAANAGNYGLNVLLGRWMTPEQFSDASLMVALLLLVTAAAVGLQLLAARFVGILDPQNQPDRADRLMRHLLRWARALGVVSAVLLCAAAQWWQDLFHTGSPWPFVLLGVAMPAYLVQAVGRGVLQGRMRFGRLAATFVVEALVRVIGTSLLVALGWGVVGATAGLSVSLLATWLAVRILLPTPSSDSSRISSQTAAAGADPADLAEARTYAGMVSILLVAQIVINNGDLLVAKSSLDPAEAGSYAMVALIGRAVFFLSWSVATVVFPAAVRRQAVGQDSGNLLRGGLIAVMFMGACCSAVAWWIGGPTLNLMVGPAYAGLSEQLAGYAMVATCFAMANLIATHQLSAGRIRESWVVLGAAVSQTVLLLIWHQDAWQLIQIQALAMLGTLLALGITMTGSWLGSSRSASTREVSLS